MAIPGLVPVNTPAGVLMMAPGMAAEVAPYVDPVLGDPNLVAQGALPQAEPPIQAPPPTHVAQAPSMFDQLDAVPTPGDVLHEQAADNLKNAAPAAGQATSSAPAVGSTAEAGMDPELERLLANPPSTIATSSTRRTGVPFTGPNREAFDQAQRAGLDAEQRAAQAVAAQADAQTAQARLEAEQAMQMARTEATRRARQDAVINDARNKRELAWMKVPEKLDPNRWDKTGGPARILGAIGVLLGGISSGITGRDNAAKALIDGIVRDDLEVQRSEIELAQQEAQRADNELQDYLDLYGDPILAEKQLEISANGAIIKELQAIMQSAQGEQVKASAELGIAERQAEVARLNNEMDGRVGEMVTQSQNDPGLENRQWEMKVKTRAAQAEAKNDPLAGLKESDKNAIRQTQVIMPDGSVKYAKDKEASTKAREIFTSYERGYQLLDELEQIARTPKSSMSPELRARAEQMEGELTKVVGSLLAPGEALSDGERKYFQSIALSASAGADVFGVVQPMIKQARDMFRKRAELATSGQLYDDPFRTKPTGKALTTDPRVRKGDYD